MMTVRLTCHLSRLATQDPRSFLPEIILDEIHMFRYYPRFASFFSVSVFLGPAHLRRPSTTGFLACSGIPVFLCRFRVRRVFGFACLDLRLRLCRRMLL